MRPFGCSRRDQPASPKQPFIFTTTLAFNTECYAKECSAFAQTIAHCQCRSSSSAMRREAISCSRLQWGLGGIVSRSPNAGKIFSLIAQHEPTMLVSVPTMITKMVQVLVRLKNNTALRNRL